MLSYEFPQPTRAKIMAKTITDADILFIIFIANIPPDTHVTPVITGVHASFISLYGFLLFALMLPGSQRCLWPHRSHRHCRTDSLLQFFLCLVDHLHVVSNISLYCLDLKTVSSNRFMGRFGSYSGMTFFRLTIFIPGAIVSPFMEKYTVKIAMSFLLLCLRLKRPVVIACR